LEKPRLIARVIRTLASNIQNTNFVELAQMKLCRPLA
jgi:hypothetical protein